MPIPIILFYALNSGCLSFALVSTCNSLLAWCLRSFPLISFCGDYFSYYAIEVSFTYFLLKFVNFYLG
jgi:hypothetical protein